MTTQSFNAWYLPTSVNIQTQMEGTYMLPKYGSFFRGVVLFHDLEQTSQSLGSRQTPGTRLVNHTFGPLSFL